MAILGDVDDLRDLSYFLTVLNYAALKLGLNTLELFAGAASLTSSDLLRDRMRTFPMLPRKYQDLRAFHLRERNTVEGFDVAPDS